MKIYFPFLILICLIHLASFRIYAQTDWFFTAINGSGDLHYIDKDFTNLPKGIIQVWEKVILANEDYTISLQEWDCSKKTFRVMQTSRYAQNRLVESINRPTDWRRFVPDSIGMLIYINVCEVDKNGKLKTNKYDDKTEKIDRTLYSFAQIIIEDANLMSEADSKSNPVRRLTLGERLALLSDEPDGIWYKVLDIQTGEEGWLNGFDMKIITPDKSVKKKTAAKNKPKAKT